MALASVSLPPPTLPSTAWPAPGAEEEPWEPGPALFHTPGHSARGRLRGPGVAWGGTPLRSVAGLSAHARLVHPRGPSGAQASSLSESEGRPSGLCSAWSHF